MIQDTQEYLQIWEKENNPFYPKEMRWDRLKVNMFLKDYKEQLIIGDVSKQRELLIAYTEYLAQQDITTSTYWLEVYNVDTFLKSIL